VGKVRWLFTAQKAGHAGTLDPLASGILPIALGEATKTVPFLMEADKSYRCEISWGEARDTLDAEGEVTATSEVRPTAEQIKAALPNFIGEIDQIPPKYSAIKIDGKRAYDLARAGEDIEMKARRVRVDDVRLIEAGPDSAVIEVDCGKGTYIRSLAHSLRAAQAIWLIQIDPSMDGITFAFTRHLRSSFKSCILQAELLVGKVTCFDVD
jgi:tRNA pseudouridine55 synthase